MRLSPKGSEYLWEVRQFPASRLRRYQACCSYRTKVVGGKVIGETPVLI